MGAEGMDRLKGKTALVIGSHTGIGREVCRLFALEGAGSVLMMRGAVAALLACAGIATTVTRRCSR
jgi:NAD(P)-dependent dehydrogenase (short-subunit alcohol dehydrogenase family)